MDKDIEKIVTNFKKIANKKWIRSISNNNSGSIGLTFEKELKKEPDSLYFPDFYGVEIKCTSRFSNYPISLFSISFDGPTFPEIDRIVEKYGYYDKDFSDKKVLFGKVYCKTKNRVNFKYKFQFEIDEKDEKLYLCVYDTYENLIERKSFIYLDSIKRRLELKLNKLAIVFASTKKVNEEKYFRYYKIALYNLTDFDTFLKLLKNDEINVEIVSRIGKSGLSKGKYKNKNMVFSISKDKIEKLFAKIYEYDNDLSEIYFM